VKLLLPITSPNPSLLLLARPASSVGCRRWGFTDERLPLLPVFLGLPTLDLGIPGLPPLSSPTFPPPSFPPPLSPNVSPGPHPLNQLGGLGSAVSSSSGVWGEALADKGTNDLVHI